MGAAHVIASRALRPPLGSTPGLPPLPAATAELLCSVKTHFRQAKPALPPPSPRTGPTAAMGRASVLPQNFWPGYMSGPEPGAPVRLVSSLTPDELARSLEEKDAQLDRFLGGMPSVIDRVPVSGARGFCPFWWAALGIMPTASAVLYFLTLFLSEIVEADEFKTFALTGLEPAEDPPPPQQFSRDWGAVLVAPPKKKGKHICDAVVGRVRG